MLLLLLLLLLGIGIFLKRGVKLSNSIRDLESGITQYDSNVDRGRAPFSHIPPYLIQKEDFYPIPFSRVPLWVGVLPK